jgi:hypothetical protein
MYIHCNGLVPREKFRVLNFQVLNLQSSEVERIDFGTANFCSQSSEFVNKKGIGINCIGIALASGTEHRIPPVCTFVSFQGIT